MLKLKENVEIQIPNTPTLITIEKIPLDIANFNTSELQKIGKAWTLKLIKTAKERKTQYQKKHNI